MRYQITLVKSLIGRKPNQVKTAYALGLRGIGQVAIVIDNPATRGQIATIKHLLTITEIEGENHAA